MSSKTSGRDVFLTCTTTSLITTPAAYKGIRADHIEKKTHLRNFPLLCCMNWIICKIAALCSGNVPLSFYVITRG